MNALEQINHLVAVNGGDIEKAQELFIADVQARNQEIPVFNASSKSGSLVRFRGMLQDNGFSPQIYMAQLNLVHSETGERKTVSCHFTDRVADLLQSDKWEIDEGANDFMLGKYAQKTPFYCVSTPGQTSWVDLSGNVGTFLEDNLKSLHINESARNVHAERKVCRSTEKAVIVKVYGKEPVDLQLGSLNEFIAILELPDVVEETKLDEDTMESTSNAYLIQDELAAFNTLPILHVVYYESVSPLIHPLQTQSVDAKSARDITLNFLLPYVMGDTLAAEYLLVHMVSKIRARHEVIQTGNIPLNLCNIQNTASSSAIIHAIESLLPRVRDIPLSIEYLNKKRIAPGVFVSRESWKEMHTGPPPAHGAPAAPPTEQELAVHGLVTGELQVPDRTYVVIDEVGMDSGILKEQGVINVHHLNDVITSAELPFAIGNGCDSPDHSAGKLAVDFSILVLSQAKCMFDIQCVVPVEPSPSHTLPSVECNATPSLDTLNTMRAYIGSVTRNEEYNISEEMNETLTSFFLSKRKETSQNGQPLYTQELFMLRMEIARALTVLDGKQELALEAWNKSGEMEAERLKRRAIAVATAASSSGAAVGVKQSGEGVESLER
ncbi:UNVERIFIED_CONTAM: hypothetical protein HDU68_011604 [Siphonaria sp. JEL0065]|nr:hypothetical protein HDU68_011604 [Siphonaria sp. JEL0065]